MGKNKIVFIIIVLAIAALFQSCSIFRLKSDSSDSTVLTPIVQPIVDIVSDLNSSEIIIDCDKTCTEKEKTNLIELVKHANRVFYGSCFKNYFESKKNFDFANGATGNEIIKKFRSKDIKTTLTYFYKRKNPFTGNLVVGYENGDGKIHANRAAWNQFNNEEKVSNIIHEITHQLGFSHDGNSYKGNENSVPYQANEAVDACF